MTGADVCRVADKSRALARWVSGHSTDDQFRAEFSRFDPVEPACFADSWAGVTVAAVLLGALVAMAWAWLG